MGQLGRGRPATGATTREVQPLDQPAAADAAGRSRHGSRGGRAGSPVAAGSPAGPGPSPRPAPRHSAAVRSSSSAQPHRWRLTSTWTSTRRGLSGCSPSGRHDPARRRDRRRRRGSAGGGARRAADSPALRGPRRNAAAVPRTDEQVEVRHRPSGRVGPGHRRQERALERHDLDARPPRRAPRIAASSSCIRRDPAGRFSPACSASQSSVGPACTGPAPDRGHDAGQVRREPVDRRRPVGTPTHVAGPSGGSTRGAVAVVALRARWRARESGRSRPLGGPRHRAARPAGPRSGARSHRPPRPACRSCAAGRRPARRAAGRLARAAADQPPSHGQWISSASRSSPPRPARSGSDRRCPVDQQDDRPGPRARDGPPGLDAVEVDLDLGSRRSAGGAARPRPAPGRMLAASGSRRWTQGIPHSSSRWPPTRTKTASSAKTPKPRRAQAMASVDLPAPARPCRDDRRGRPARRPAAWSTM